MINSRGCDIIIKQIENALSFLQEKNYQIKQIKFKNKIEYIAFKTNDYNRWLLIHICNEHFIKEFKRNYEYCSISMDGLIWSYNAVTDLTVKSITDYINIMNIYRDKTDITDDNEYNRYLFDFFYCNGYEIL